MATFAYFFPAFFIGMIVLVSYVISRMGWSDLAEKYRFDEKFEGKDFGVISAGINGTSYNNCLRLKYNEQGFYLRPIMMFRLFHKGIFIPWDEIKAARDKQILFVKLKQLLIGEPTVAIIQIKSSTYEKLDKETYLRGFSNRRPEKPD